MFVLDFLSSTYFTNLLLFCVLMVLMHGCEEDYDA